MIRPRVRLPVTPLSEAAWARIREEVLSELEREPVEPMPAPGGRRRRAAWTLAAALLASVALWFIFVRAPAPASLPARISTKGDVAHATVGDATLEVGPDSDLLSVGHLETGFTVTLERGRVRFVVPPRRGGAPFRVRAGDVSVEVVGTRFSVERDSNGVVVGVEEGVVSVTSPVGVQLLWPGERFSNATVQEDEPAPLGEPERPRSPAAIQSVAPVEKAAPGQAGAHRPAIRRQVPPSRRELYDAASRAEAANDPARAHALYLELAKGGDAWAANALYAAGRLAFERRERSRARELLGSYLERFPSGYNAREARALLARLQ